MSHTAEYPRPDSRKVVVNRRLAELRAQIDDLKVVKRTTEEGIVRAEIEAGELFDELRRIDEMERGISRKNEIKAILAAQFMKIAYQMEYLSKCLSAGDPWIEGLYRVLSTVCLAKIADDNLSVKPTDSMANFIYTQTESWGGYIKARLGQQSNVTIMVFTPWEGCLVFEPESTGKYREDLRQIYEGRGSWFRKDVIAFKYAIYKDKPLDLDLVVIKDAQLAWQQGVDFRRFQSRDMPGIVRGLKRRTLLHLQEGEICVGSKRLTYREKQNGAITAE